MTVRIWAGGFILVATGLVAAKYAGWVNLTQSTVGLIFICVSIIVTLLIMDALIRRGPSS